ncbi:MULTISPECIES: Imm15 family immunity protein [unclassified Pseudomonas]|uniref:Imm15 family immunity protein n=1 Tax=unclassified Pseudomonas TaxID=196821 RepID=UPI001F58837D|nr:MULTISPECIES: Imm15 family immunity protein [unclassified Pseudomonas]
MKLAEIYSKIISKEPYNDMAVFFESYESFEEIPLVSRYKRLDFLKKEMSNERVSAVLAGAAIFLMNLIRVMGPAGTLNFYAITFTDFDSLDDQDVIIPNIFVYPTPASVGFLDKLKENSGGVTSQEMKEVKDCFDKLGSKALFDFYESRFYDSACGEDIIRIYAVPKKDFG